MFACKFSLFLCSCVHKHFIHRIFYFNKLIGCKVIFTCNLHWIFCCILHCSLIIINITSAYTTFIPNINPRYWINFVKQIYFCQFITGNLINTQINRNIYINKWKRSLRIYHGKECWFARTNLHKNNIFLKQQQKSLYYIFLLCYITPVVKAFLFLETNHNNEDRGLTIWFPWMPFYYTTTTTKLLQILPCNNFVCIILCPYNTFIITNKLGKR
jgi:hypothetical protein